MDELNRQNVRFSVVGFRQNLAKEVRDAIDFSEQKTVQNTGLRLNVAINYGGKAEIVHAANTLAKQVAAGQLDEIDEEAFAQALFTGGQPDVDFVVRTSGELRLSNFLLFQSAYAELYFPDVLWPDFDKDEYHKALYAYVKRDRRYGALK